MDDDIFDESLIENEAESLVLEEEAEEESY